ncbi:NADH-quinone oxidoreductase subunit C [Nonomuraea dietziae]|uniref:NADH:ubiquinone oxidoreductase subunit C n=1 Tax=Nonomuraea dietziae TaxID=65515 RepID=A0A7W5VCI1_9ACTN|nr:NADH-quinone oxidoreductase subunit C [Nonomuraea dietziae]MBB3729064.1 NADH:ubiquinone oxidoreductase subunit C [Nonomuraea dietziae]
MTLAERFGDRVQVSESWGERTVDVAASDWIELLTFCRDTGYEFFDWLSGVDEPPDAFGVVAHVYNPSTHERLLLRTRVPRADPRLPSAVGVYRGANWHERETFEMFGVIFDDHPYLVPLLLPDGFEGHPLRKDFVLAARVAKAWPGAKEPGESGHGAPSRRKTLPPGVPADWPSPSTSTGPAAPPIPGEQTAPASTAERPEPSAGPGEPAPPSAGSAAERPAPAAGSGESPPSGSTSPERLDAPGSPSTSAASPSTPAGAGEAASSGESSSQSSKSRAPLEEPDG